MTLTNLSTKKCQKKQTTKSITHRNKLRRHRVDDVSDTWYMYKLELVKQLEAKIDKNINKTDDDFLDDLNRHKEMQLEEASYYIKLGYPYNLVNHPLLSDLKNYLNPTTKEDEINDSDSDVEPYVPPNSDSECDSESDHTSDFDDMVSEPYDEDEQILDEEDTYVYF